MSFLLRRSASAPSLSRWPLLALAALLILLLVVSALLWAGTSPAGAQDGHAPDPQVVDDVWDYARETQHGADHVLRWMRVLHTFGVMEDMSAAEAQDHADQFWAARWDPVVTELTNLEAQDDYTPDPQVVDDVRGYSAETDNGFDHVLRWMRVLHTLGALDAMSASEAQGYADQYTAARWDPVVSELTAIETAAAAAAEPDPTATPEPNRAPVVNTQAKYYSRFTGNNNAPRGVLVSKPFYEVFSDPDGDELTYSVAISGGDSQLVDDLQITTEAGRDPNRDWPPYGTYYRVWFQADGDDDWKAITPTLPDRPVITVTLTATDPEGLTASVSGDFVIWWESYPEVVNARADGAAIELTFDWAVESDPAPAPGQFTVHVVNEDGSAGTIEVNRVSVNGKVVTLELASALDESQTVTLDYAYNYPDDTPLQRAGGGDAAPGFTGQAVAFLQPPGEPANFAVGAEPGSLDIAATWDAPDSATSYKLRWRQSGGEFDAANTTTVSDTNATITVADYGQWEVRLQGCNDAGCGPEVSGTVELHPLGQPANFAVSVEQGELELSAKWDAVAGATFYQLRWRQPGGQFTAANTTTVADTKSAITMSDYGEWETWLQACNDAGCAPEANQSADEAPVVRFNLESVQEEQVQEEQSQSQSRARALAETSGHGPIDSKASYTVGWHRDGADAPAPSQPDTSRQRSAAPGTPGATGQGANGATDTTPPMLLRGEIDGDTTTVYFTEDLDADYRGGHFRMTVSHGNGWVNFTVTPSSVSIDGNKVTLVGVLDWGPG